MSHLTSIETSLALRDEGFQQPDFSVGQHWWVYYPEQKAWHLAPMEIAVKDYAELKKHSDLVDIVYAATATQVLPDGCDLVKESGDWAVGKNGKRIGGWDANPAEAAASAYFHKKNKQL